MGKYTSEQLQSALADIRNGGNCKAVARLYGIPRSTLVNRMKNKLKSETIGLGFLTMEEEKSFCSWITELARKGFPRKKEDIQLSVQKFLEADPRPNPFKDNYPGNKWFNLFLRRNPEVAQTATHTNEVSENDIRKWFKEIEAYLNEIGALQILDDPTRIFNGDETNFQLCSKTQHVILRKGEKNVCESQAGSEKENIACMCAFSASGQPTPPMVIFPYRKMPKTVVDSLPSSWGIGLSENGWMDLEVFSKYVENVFYPHLVQMKVRFPVILFVDGQKTHVSYQLSETCTKLEIVLVALYPNSTRIMQPADVAAFRPIKTAWQSVMRSWKSRHPCKPVTRVDFCAVLEDILSKHTKAETVRNGFRAAGLHPWNQELVNYSKCAADNRASPSGACEPMDTSEDTSGPALQQSHELDCEKFCSIVGEDVLNEIQECADGSCVCNPYLEKLAGIWKFFNQNEGSPMSTEQVIIQW